MSALTLAQANTLINAALEAARAAGCPPLAVVVLDESGQLKAAQREDGASMLRADIATGKAYAAVGMGVDSRVLTERAKGNPVFFTSLAAAAQGPFLAQTGAVLIRDASGRILGAAGASGGTGDEDEAACLAGVRALGLTAA